MKLTIFSLLAPFFPWLALSYNFFYHRTPIVTPSVGRGHRGSTGPSFRVISMQNSNGRRNAYEVPKPFSVGSIGNKIDDFIVSKLAFVPRPILNAIGVMSLTVSALVALKLSFSLLIPLLGLFIFTSGALLSGGVFALISVAALYWIFIPALFPLVLANLTAITVLGTSLAIGSAVVRALFSVVGMGTEYRESNFEGVSQAETGPRRGDYVDVEYKVVEDVPANQDGIIDEYEDQNRQLLDDFDERLGGRPL
jgi:hypothetical protein